LRSTDGRRAPDAAMNWHYLYTFAQTNLLEIAVCHLFYRRFIPFRRTALVATCANLITHPVVFFGFMSSGLSVLTAILWAEIFAFVSEGFLHKRYLGEKPLSYFMLVSFSANFFSWQSGPLLTYWFFWRT
jgi:hypothetical protein